jgi:hypothetical protein
MYDTLKQRMELENEQERRRRRTVSDTNESPAQYTQQFQEQEHERKHSHVSTDDETLSNLGVYHSPLDPESPNPWPLIIVMTGNATKCALSMDAF